MYLVYQPEGSDGPKRWKYDPKRLMSAEREILERKTSRNYTAFAAGVEQGSSLCRRALLFVFLRRENPKIRWEDVDFAWDELEVEYSRAELDERRAEAVDSLTGDELAAVVAQIDRMIPDAYDEGDEGKAKPPSGA